MFPFSYRKHYVKEKRISLVYFDYQNGSSLYYCHRYVNRSCLYRYVSVYVVRSVIMQQSISTEDNLNLSTHNFTIAN